MKVKIFIIATISIFLSSCSGSKPTTFYDANGKQSKAVTCSIYNESSCIKQAGEICKKKGYKVIRHTWPSPYVRGLDIQCN